MTTLHSIENLTAELERLEGIKNHLAGLIVDLKLTNPDSLFIGLYQDRLKLNVLPAIKLTKGYILKTSN